MPVRLSWQRRALRWARSVNCLRTVWVIRRREHTLAYSPSSVPSLHLNFQTSPKCWSIAGIVEHVAMVEDAVFTRISQEIMSAPSVPADSHVPETDAGLLRKAVDRSVKLEAPGQFHPTGKSMAISLGQFLASREKIVDFIRSTLNLRHISTQHRVFGPIDGH